MNHRRPWWIALSLLPPLFALVALLLPFGCGGGGGNAIAPVAPTPGNVAIAFVGQGPPGNFAKVLLNISGVRINPAANADTSAPGWVTIAVPTQAGTGNGQNPGDVQIDLLHSQTAATFFNTGGVPEGTYQTVQVLVNDNDPGLIVPACASAGSGNEGCTQYSMKSTGVQVPVIFTLGTPMNVSVNQTQPLVINLAVAINSPPGSTGQPYIVTITPSEVPAGTFLAQVSGSLTARETGGTSGTTIQASRKSVFAELSGTNNVIENVPVRNGGAYTLELPAAPNGTSYDIYSSGGGTTYGALQGVTVFPGQGLVGEDITVFSTMTGAITGVISDFCSGVGIGGAQVQLLAPAATPSPSISPTSTPTGSSLCFDDPGRCVVVASGTADQAGNYPLPGTTRLPSGLDTVPDNQRDLAIVVSASGYNPLTSTAKARSQRLSDCSASTSTTTCNFSLTSGTITGTVNLVSDPPPGDSVFVQVMAENSGTNDLVSALDVPLNFVNGQKSLPFTLRVPVSAQPLDLFAVAIDPFLGGPDPFPGHDIPVLATQPAPATACAQTSTTAQFAAMDCVGHGSITGTVINPDPTTAVEIEKLDPNNSVPVQLISTPSFLFSSDPNFPNNAYTLCVPPDTYALQRFELPPSTPNATPSSTPTAVGAPQSITVPVPASTSSPCPSTCSNSNSMEFPCPGICGATNAAPL